MLLYIHIPFCDSKCHYCAFNSYVDKFHLKKDYMEALKIQLDFELKRFKATKNSIETLFIGGGTPSTVEPKLYEKIFKTLKPYINPHAEITIEANPNSASKEWLECVFELGINRISFGVQSFDEQKLKTLNRNHSPQQAKNAILNAEKIGFENISLDIIYGVLCDTKQLLENDIKTAVNLPINHLSAYALSIEKETIFEKKPQMANENTDTTRWFFDKIKSHGFNQYEISNFGYYQSKHNLGYWQYKDYIGLGSGAVGKLGSKRFYPCKNVEKYISNPLDIKTEKLSDKNKKFEQIFLGLRCVVGIDKNILDKNEQNRAIILTNEKKLCFKNERFYNKDYLLSDEIALFIIS